MVYTTIDGYWWSWFKSIPRTGSREMCRKNSIPEGRKIHWFPVLFPQDQAGECQICWLYPVNVPFLLTQSLFFGSVPHFQYQVFMFDGQCEVRTPQPPTLMIRSPFHWLPRAFTMSGTYGFDRQVQQRHRGLEDVPCLACLKVLFCCR